MKNKLLILIPFTIFCISSYAYTPMLKQGYSWTYSACRFSEETSSIVKVDNKIVRAHGGLRVRNYQYTLYLDTIINGLTYYHLVNTTCDQDYMLREGKDNPYDISPVDKNYKIDNERYMFREDTIQQKVYIYDKQNGKESLLYDFSLNKGDSACVFFRTTPYFKLYRVSQARLSLDDYSEISSWNPKNPPQKITKEILQTLNLSDEEIDAKQDSLFGKIDACDSTMYSTIYITDVNFTIDAFGDTIKIFSFTQKNLWGFENSGVYYERYGCMYGFLYDYISYKQLFTSWEPYRMFVDYWFRCGMNEYGQPGLHEQGQLYDEYFDCSFDDYSFPMSAPFAYRYEKNDFKTQELAWPHWVLRYP